LSKYGKILLPGPKTNENHVKQIPRCPEVFRVRNLQEQLELVGTSGVRLEDHVDDPLFRHTQNSFMDMLWVNTSHSLRV